MLVAIVPSTPGVVSVEEFRSAESVEQALAEFCAAYSPPRSAPDWLAIDTGWSDVPAVELGWYWTGSEFGDGDLDGWRAKCLAEIDARTDALIAQGFEYPPSSGKFFSLSLEAQLRIQGCMSSRDLPQFVFPVAWNTIDDRDHYDVADANDMVGFYLTALGTLRSKIDSGTALKEQVRVAADIAEIQAVVDSR